MPVVAILLGVVLIDLAFRGTEHKFAQQLGQDFAGGGFWAWLAAIAIVGAIGYYSPLKTISNLGVALIVIGLIFSNAGVLTQFANVIEKPPSPEPSVPLPQFDSIKVQTSSSSSGSGGSGGLTNTALQLVSDYYTGGLVSV